MKQKISFKNYLTQNKIYLINSVYFYLKESKNIIVHVICIFTEINYYQSSIYGEGKAFGIFIKFCAPLNPSTPEKNFVQFCFQERGGR